ncbi:MAG: RnfABCDGE type electron transport complex subunit D [Pseudomonadota bacterium]|nr:RnfABCDGE type electron transport complex subunit D [Pseudomonadota bacterium]
MIFIRSSAPHVHSLKSTRFIMGCTAFALMPAAAALTFAYGFGVIWHIIIAVAAAEIFEALCILLRGKSVGTALGDLSALLTAVIFALAVPPYLPWYLVTGGMLFGIVVVKHCFGGLGQNTFNPAMAAYVLLLVSFPGQMTAWIAPSPENFEKLGFSESLEVISGQKTVSEAMVLHGSSMGSVRKAGADSSAPAASDARSALNDKSVTGSKETTVKGTDAATHATVQNTQGKPGSGTDGKTGATAAAGTDGHKFEGKTDSAGIADGTTHATVAAGTDGRTGATASAGMSVSDGKKADDTKADGATNATAAAGADGKTGATEAAGKSVSDGKKADGTRADGATHATAKADAATYATPLSKYKVEKNKNGIYYPYVKKGTLSELDISTYGVKVVSLAFLLGGLVLMVTRMIFISVPLSVLGSVAFFSWMYQVLGDAGDFPVMTITDQLLTGATMMGAFFIYTDPVGSASTTRAKTISGILVGFFIVTVRNFGGYPDAVAFGALLANSINPLLDRLIRPIRFGRLGEAA